MANNGNGGQPHPMVDTLDGTNYETWAFEMMHLLLAKGVYYYVTGEEVLPDPSTAKEKAKWRDGDGRALGLILLHVHKPLHQALKNITNSKAMWDKLKDIHQPKTRDHLMSKFSRFWDLRMTPGMPMPAWTSTLAEAAADLRRSNFTIDELSLCFQLIRFLPNEYGPVIRIIQQLPDADFTYQEISTRLIAEEDRLRQQTIDSNQGVYYQSNYNGSNSQQQQRHQRNRRNARGQGARQQGRGRGAPNTALYHAQAPPPSYDQVVEDYDDDENSAGYEQSHATAQRNMGNMICKHCGVRGHFATRCPAPHPRPLPPAAQSVPQGESQPNIARAHSVDIEADFNRIARHAMCTIDTDNFIQQLENDKDQILSESTYNLLTAESGNIVYLLNTISAERTIVDQNQKSFSGLKNPKVLFRTEDHQSEEKQRLFSEPEVDDSAFISLDGEAVFSIDTSNIWLMDSGASSHFCNNREMFHEFRPANTTAKTTGKSGHINIRGHGTIGLQIGNEYITFSNVCYAPDARINLISESRIDLAGYGQIKKHGIHRVIDNDLSTVFEAKLTHFLYLVNVKNNTSMNNVGNLSPVGPMHTTETANMTATLAPPTPIEPVDAQPEPAEVFASGSNKPPAQGDYNLWHKRFGHVHESLIRHIAHQGLVRGMPARLTPTNSSPCSNCHCAKATNASLLPIAGIQTTKVLELLHMDIWGPTKHTTANGMRYFLSIIDDYTRKSAVFLMKQKSEVFDIFKQYQARIEREHKALVVNIRTDKGMEFCHNEFSQYCNELGILHQRTNTYTPQQNGVAERFNRTMMNHCKIMNQSAGLPKTFWGEALKTAVYIRNRVTTYHYPDITPMEMWTGRKPNVQHLRVYGCKAYAHVPSERHDNSNPTAKEGILLGYSPKTRGYRIFIWSERQIVEIKSATFDERKFPAQKVQSPRKPIEPRKTYPPATMGLESSDNSDFMDSGSSDDDQPRPPSSASEDQGIGTMMPTESGESGTHTPVENEPSSSHATLPQERGHETETTSQANLEGQLRDISPISNEGDTQPGMNVSMSSPRAERKHEQLEDEIHSRNLPKKTERPKQVHQPVSITEKGPRPSRIPIIISGKEKSIPAYFEDPKDPSEKTTPFAPAQKDVKFIRKNKAIFKKGHATERMYYFQAEDSETELYDYEELEEYCKIRKLDMPVNLQGTFITAPVKSTVEPNKS